MNEKKKKKPPAKPKDKNLSEIYAETVDLLSKGLNQMGITYDKTEPWEEVAAKCGKDPKLKAALEENIRLFKQNECRQTFSISFEPDLD